jgi:arylsulfatase A-like enzyme
MQTDAAVGRVLEALDAGGLARDTMVIFTSDNGCSPAADVKGLEAQGHFPSADYRGYKSDIWEGGHRVPFVVRWPATVKAGTRNEALLCQTDLMATCADLLGDKLPDIAGEDSISFLPLLDGRPAQPARRQAVINHSIQGKFAIRDKRWKLEFCPGSGGWGAPTDPAAKSGGLPAVQLYDMSKDAREQRNVEAMHPDVVRELTALLKSQVETGRSTPGRPQSNDVAVRFEK